MAKLSRRNFLKGLAAVGAFVIVPYSPKLLGEISTNKDGFIYYVNGHHWFELRAEMHSDPGPHMIAWYGLCPNKKGIIQEYGNALYVPYTKESLSGENPRSYIRRNICQALWVDFNKCGNRSGFFKRGAPSLKKFNDSLVRFYNQEKPGPNGHLKDNLRRGDIIDV